jgi:hypothetical protein
MAGDDRGTRRTYHRPRALARPDARHLPRLHRAFNSRAAVARYIGANGFKFAADLAGIAAFDAQLKSYIRRSVRDSFSGNLAAAAKLSDRQIRAIVDRTYQEVWDLLVAQGDAEE